jgi:hypothetical protein
MADMVATYIRARSEDKTAMGEYWDIIEPMIDGSHGVEFGAIVADRLASAGMIPQVEGCMVWTWDEPSVEDDGAMFWSFEHPWEPPMKLIEDVRALFPTIKFEVWNSGFVMCDGCDEEIDRYAQPICVSCGYDNS